MIISNISVPMLGMVDTAVLGHLDAARYLAGVAVGSAIFALLFTGMNFLRMGTTGIAAQAFGRNSGAQIRQALWQAVIVALVLSVAMIALQYPIATVAWQLLGPDELVREAAASYFHTRIWAAPAILINFAILGWFIGLHNTRVPLLVVLTVNIANIILDIVFVNGLGMTSDGVALASALAETLGLLVGGYFVYRELAKFPQPMTAHALTKLASYKEFFAINANLFLRTIALVGTFAFITAQGARFGAVILAANAILMNLQLLLSYALDGLANAAEALVGKAWGARQIERVKQAVSVSLRWSLGVALGFALLFALAGKPLIGLLTNIENVRLAALTYLPWLIISPIVSVWCFLYDGVFVGATWSREMRIVMLASAAFVFLPAWWLSLPLGNHGLWLAFCLFMAARGIGMAYFYHRNINRLIASDSAGIA